VNSNGETHYRDLVVWQRAIDLVPCIYSVARTLPPEERYALGDQLRRAAISIPANIAEGQARQHPKEFLQHLAIARGSLAELDTLLIMAKRLYYIDQNAFDALSLSLEQVAEPLHGLIARLADYSSPATRSQQATTTLRSPRS
jgi:four helix bundle protein